MQYHLPQQRAVLTVPAAAEVELDAGFPREESFRKLRRVRRLEDLPRAELHRGATRRSRVRSHNGFVAGQHSPKERANGTE